MHYKFCVITTGNSIKEAVGGTIKAIDNLTLNPLSFCDRWSIGGIWDESGDYRNRKKNFDNTFNAWADSKIFWELVKEAEILREKEMQKSKNAIQSVIEDQKISLEDMIFGAKISPHVSAHINIISNLKNGIIIPESHLFIDQVHQGGLVSMPYKANSSCMTDNIIKLIKQYPQHNWITVVDVIS